MHRYFLWQGVNHNGKRQYGISRSSDVRSLRAQLIRKNILSQWHIGLPEGVGQLAKIQAEQGGLKHIPGVLRQLATLTHAGIPLVQALEIIQSTTRHPGLTQALEEVIANVATGQSLAASLQDHPRLFDAITCHLINAGEQASALEPLLERVAQHAEQQAMLKQKVRRAMRYPLLVLAVASAVSLALLLFVVPRFAAMFNDFGAELPVVTARVMAASEWLSGGGWYAALIALAAMILGFRLTLRSPRVALAVDRLKLSIPLLGSFQQRALLARLTRTLGLMLQAGMPLSEALPSAAQAMNNQYFVQLTQAVQAEINSGQSLAHALREAGKFPPHISQMIAVGEETGELGEMLRRVAVTEEAAVEATVDSMGAMIEPLLMVFLGLVVGGLVLAMYLPVFQMGGVF